MRQADDTDILSIYPFQVEAGRSASSCTLDLATLNMHVLRWNRDIGGVPFPLNTTFNPTLGTFDLRGTYHFTRHGNN